MMHLSIFQRTQIIELYLQFRNMRNVCDIVKTIAKERYGIVISRWGVRNMIKNYRKCQKKFKLLKNILLTYLRYFATK